MPSPNLPAPLSKSRYLAALQCDRRLWLDAYDPARATPPGDAQRHIFRMGGDVGRAARALFPGGVLIEEPASAHEAAMARTRERMADASIPALFEAAFEHAGLRIRVDVLERRPGGRWGLREVKSSGSLKPAQHVPDLAVQRWVLEESGLEIDSVELIHVNRQFVRGAGELDCPRYFLRADVRDLLDRERERGRERDDASGIRGAFDVASRIEAMRRTLERTEAPEREPGAFCKKPHACAYWDACTAEKTRAWRVQQRRASAGKMTRMLEVTQSGQIWHSSGLAAALARVLPPVWALDFEAIGLAIPPFGGTRPYQALPFQWSLHRLQASGELEHFEHLADGRGDPRPALASALVSRLAGDGSPILAYSSYESRCLAELAAAVPALAEPLEGIRARLVDLHRIVKAHVYHPAFEGSFSLKAVGPALVPALRYEGGEAVHDGLGALAAFARMLAGDVEPQEEARLRRELLDYCRLDTLALIETHRALMRLVRPAQLNGREASPSAALTPRR